VFVDPSAAQEEIILNENDRDNLDLDEDMDVRKLPFTTLIPRMIPHQMQEIPNQLLPKTTP
jgi:hypothetical protein